MSAATAVAAPPMPRKRPAADQEPRAADANKRPRYRDVSSIDDYEVLEVLGEGAEGVVSRARDRRTGKEVALRWIRGDGPGGHGPPDRRALAMEAGCLHACRGHPNIIGIDGVAVDPKTGDVHLVLELIEGGLSLRDSFWRTLSEDKIRGMMRQLIGAAKKVWISDIKDAQRMVAVIQAGRCGAPGRAYQELQVWIICMVLCLL